MNIDDTKLKQSNNLILATHKMTTNQMRIFFYVCSQYKGDLKLELSFNDMNRLLNDERGSNQKDLLIKNIDTMMKNAFIDLIIDDDDEYYKAPVFILARKKQNDDLMRFEFNPYVAKELDALRGYTWMYLTNLTGMSSTYSIRLYEFFAMRLGSKSTSGSFEFDINQLRIYLDCINKYGQFCDFDKRVLKTSHKEINEKTNISMSYSKIKTSRSVTSIVFKFAYKDDTNANIVDTTYTVHHDQDNNVLNGQLSFEIQQMLSQFD